MYYYGDPAVAVAAGELAPQNEHTLATRLAKHSTRGVPMIQQDDTYPGPVRERLRVQQVFLEPPAAKLTPKIRIFP